MTRIINCLSVLLALTLVTFTNAKTLTLASQGNDTVELTYLFPQMGEDLRVEFALTTDDGLRFNESVGVFCVITQSAAYTPKVDDGMFGVNFICKKENNCTQSNSADISFYGSTVGNVGSGNVSWQYGSFNMAQNAIGNDATVYVNKTVFSNRYALDEQQAEWSNVPSPNGISYLKCLSKFSATPDEVALNAYQELDSSWDTKDQSVIVAPSEYTCEDGLS